MWSNFLQLLTRLKRSEVYGNSNVIVVRLTNPVSQLVSSVISLMHNQRFINRKHYLYLSQLLNPHIVQRFTQKLLKTKQKEARSLPNCDTLYKIRRNAIKSIREIKLQLIKEAARKQRECNQQQNEVISIHVSTNIFNHR